MTFGKRILAATFGVLALGGAAAFVSEAVAAPRRSQAPGYPEQPKEDQGKKLTEYEAQFPTKMNWTLANVNGKTPPTEATMTIDDQFRGTGTSGCNTWSAALYPVKGHHLMMGPVAQTKKECTTDVMAFERQFLGILHSGPSWDQTGYTLTVKSQGGTLVFNRGL